MSESPISTPQNENSCSANHNSSSCGVRIQYRRVKRGILKYAYAELDGHGAGMFMEEEPGDIRCYPFTPSSQEVKEVLRVHQEGRGRNNWHSLIDVDTL